MRLTITWISLLTSFLFSCTHHEKNPSVKVSRPAFKTTYTFKVNESDSIKIQLHVKVVDSLQFVKELKLSSGETLQLDSNYTYPLERFKLQAIDLNFDGYNDLRILKDRGATGNDWYETWLYQPKSKKLTKNTFLSQKSSIWVDSLNHRVVSSYWGGWADQLLEAYTVRDTSYRILQDWYVGQNNYRSVVYINTIGHNRLVKRDSLFAKKDLLSLYKLKNGYK